MLRILAVTALVAGCAEAPVPDPRAALSRAALDEFGQPLILAELPKLKAAGTMIVSGRNGDVVTWKTADEVSLSFDKGILVASRGLGQDLMSAEVAGTQAMLAGTPGEVHERLHSYLDGEYQTVFRAFRCRQTERVPETIEIVERRHATTRVTESCASPQGGFTNIYWVGGDGTIWKSRQWIGPTAGHVATERLLR